MIRAMAILFGLALVLTACGGKGGSQTANKMKAEVSHNLTNAEYFWELITVKDDYTKWALFPGVEAYTIGKSPHGAYVTLFINPDVENALPVTNGQLPYGSILVKDNYDESKELVAVTVMAKLKGFNPDGGDWVWAKFTMKDGQKVCGMVDMCIDCHSARKENDYVMMKNLSLN